VEVAVVPPDDVLSPSFDAFFTAEYRRVVGLAFALCGRRGVAEELAQDAFVKAYQRWTVVSTYDDPGAWVRRVVANMATSVLRRRMRETRALTRLAARRPPRDEIALDDPEFWAAVRDLPKRQAQCVALHYLEDRSSAEVAAVLGISEATVRVHLHRGRLGLARTLGETLDEEEAP
jgi:RNA polymerase sigma-70 factor (ECF subfamily)